MYPVNFLIMDNGVQEFGEDGIMDSNQSGNMPVQPVGKQTQPEAGNEEGIRLEYNTQREKLRMPEYGRNVQKMVEYVKSIPNKAKRDEQAEAVIKVMEILNTHVHAQDDYEQKLWDHLYIISGYDLDVDSPYPKPEPSQFSAPPAVVPVKRKRIKATHYGRNIENIIDLIAGMEEGEDKTAMIRAIAIYMRQQYLIWNKDSVADETIFHDIEALSDYRIKVPEGLKLSRVSTDISYARPGLNPVKSKNGGRQKNMGRQKNQRKQ